MTRLHRLLTRRASSYVLDLDRDPIDIEALEATRPLRRRLASYFNLTTEGAERIPREGPALIVGNHGILGLDAVLLSHAVHESTGRIPRGLGERLLFVGPWSRSLWLKSGVVPGSQENGRRLLEAGHLVIVYPGGAREALKQAAEAYRLRWEKATGFVRLALRAQAPIVLAAAMGVDDLYRILGRWPLSGLLLGRGKYELPLLWGWGPLPRPVKVTFRFSAPIHLEGGPESAGDPRHVRDLRDRLWSRAQGMLDDMLARRHSIWTG